MKTTEQSNTSFLSAIFMLLFAAFSLFLWGCDNATESDDDTYVETSAEKAVNSEDAARLVAAEVAIDNDGEANEIKEAADYEENSIGSLGKTVVDTTFTRGNWTLSIYRKFANVSGDSTDRYVDGTSTSMVFKRKLTGSYTPPISRKGGFKYMEVNRQNTHTVTGLLPEETAITINGSGSRNSFHEIENPTSKAVRTFNLTGTSTKTNIVVNKNDGDKWPESGTAVYDVTINRTVSRTNRNKDITFTRKVTITFNGTNTPVIEVESNRYKINLETGELTAAN